MNTKNVICPNDCPAACGLTLHIQDSQIIKVEGNKEHPLFHGLICDKMRKSYTSLYDENRILTPLKRIGKKGEGKFKPISWDQAIEEISTTWKSILQEHGPDAFIGLSSSGNQGRLQKNIVDTLFNKIGGREIEMTLCSGAKSAGFKSISASSGAMCPSLLPYSDYYLVWSCQLKATQLHALSTLIEQRKQGKKVVCIDVYTKENEPYCDESILIKPGSDGALALAMMHVLEKEGYVDIQFMKEHANDYEAFRETLPVYTPEWAEEKTGIPAQKIIELAREFGKAKRPSILLGTGFSRRKNGGMNTRLIFLLSAITGCWKYEGGGLVGRNPRSGPCIDMDRITHPEFRTHKGKIENINLLSLPLQEKEVKTFYVSGANPVSSIHNQVGMIQALEREDLYTVVHERVMTDTTKYADIILPATYSFEQSDIHLANGYNTISTSFQAVQPQGLAKSNWDTICLLAKAMGYTDKIFTQKVEDVLLELLEHPLTPLSQMSREERDILYKGGTLVLPYPDRTHFATKDGKLRIVDNQLENPMPQYIEDFQDPYPLNLVAISNVHTLNTMFSSRKDLIEKRGEMRLLLNPEDAKVRNLKDGDTAIVYNDLARIQSKIEINEHLVQGCVALSGVYDSSHNHQLLQINALHHARVSDIGKGTTLNGNYVDIIKVES